MDSVTQDMRFRQSLLKYSEKYGVTKAAIKYKTNRQYIYRWKRRYDGTIESLWERSRRPHHHPNEQKTENISVSDPVTVENETKETAEEPETLKEVENDEYEKNTNDLTEDDTEKKQTEEDIPEEITTPNEMANEVETGNGVSFENQAEEQQEFKTEEDTEKPDEYVSQTSDYYTPEITKPVDEPEKIDEKQPDTPPEEQDNEQSTEKDSELNEGDTVL